MTDPGPDTPGDEESLDDLAADAESVHVSHRIPAPIKDLAQERSRHGELSERVRTLYRIVATGGVAGERTQLRLELDQVRSQKDALRAEQDALRARIRDIERQEARLEERLEDQQSQEDRYVGHLESLEEQMRSGTAVFPEHGGVQKAANIGLTTPEGVIEDLRERNPDWPDIAFQQQTNVPRHERWRGVDDA